MISDKRAFSTRRLAEMIIYIVDGYKKLSIGERNRKCLLGHFYTADEIVALRGAFPGIPNSIVIQACLSYPNKTVEFLRDIVNARGKIKSEKEFEDIPEWIIMHACGSYPSNPRRYLRRFKTGEVKAFGKTYEEVVSSRRRDRFRGRKRGDAPEVDRTVPPPGVASLTGPKSGAALDFSSLGLGRIPHDARTSKM